MREINVHCLVFVLTFVIVPCYGSLSFLFGYRWKRSSTDSRETDNVGRPVSFVCGGCNVLQINYIHPNDVRVFCAPIQICNQNVHCTVSPSSGTCLFKANYLHGVSESFPSGPISGSCALFTPPVKEHLSDNCQTISVKDTLSQRNPSNMVPASNKPKPLPSRGGAHPGNGASPPTANGQTVNKAKMMLLRLGGGAPAQQVVKAVVKTADGYDITYCTLQCQQTTTTTTTVAPTTVKIVTHPNPQPPKNNPPPPPVPPPAGGGGAGSTGTNGNGGSNGNKNGGHGSGGVQGGRGGSSKEHKQTGSKERSKSSNKQNSAAAKDRRVSYGSNQQQGGGGGNVNQNQNQNNNQHGQNANTNAHAQGGGHGSHEQGRPSNGGNGNAAGGGAGGGSNTGAVAHAVAHAESHGHGNGHGWGAGGGGGGGGGCFSSEMTIQTKFGTKRMDELKIGDEVLVATSDHMESYQPVEWFYHQNDHVEATYVTITTASNRTLSLTPNHLLPMVPCFPKRLHLSDLADYVNYDSVFAKKAKRGLCLATKVGQSYETDEIVDVKMDKKKGVYSPITTQGTLIVNNFQCSCYSTVEHHFLQYGLHKSLLYGRSLIDPLLKLFTTLDTNNNNNSYVIQKEVPSVLRFIYEMAQMVVPSLIYL